MINRGSEWNIWDLHVHTPTSIFHRYGENDDVWERFISDLESLPEEFKVIGINDYLFLDGYEKLKVEQEKNDRLQNRLLIPVLEFRISKFAGVDFGKFNRINFHVIFSPDLEIETIKSQFLNTLEQSFSLESGGEKWTRAITRESVEELGNRIKSGIPKEELGKYKSDLTEGFNNLNLDEKQIFKSLEKDCFNNKYLIAIGKTEWDELKWSDSSIATKKSIINDANLVFTAAETLDNYHKAKAKLKEQKVNDFLFDCSDAHSFSEEKREKDRIGNCNNWLKADISFEGLRQVMVEKEDRLYIGETPKVHERVKYNRTKYIDSLRIDQIQGYDETYGGWFKNIEIPLNSELVAIIGNKGNGKSALADIIGLCGNYKGNQNDFSFLNKKRFNENGGKIAQNFEAVLKWKSGSKDIKKLNAEIDSSSTEKVKYLPQGYFERLTNNHSSIEEFNKEIESVVFTHLNDEDKLGCNAFQELIDYKTKISEEEIQKIKNQLSLLNKEIFSKERKLNPKHKKSIEEKKRQKEEELKALIEPESVKNPNDDPTYAEKNKETTKKLEDLNKKLKEQTNLSKEKSEEKSKFLIEINELKGVKERVENKQSEFNLFIEEIDSALSKYDLDGKSMFTITYDLTKLNSKITEKEKAYKNLKILLGEEESEDKVFKSIPGRIEEFKTQIQEIQKSLGEDEKKYQNYLIQKKDWEENKAKIIGNEKTPDTLEYYKYELKYIDEKLKGEISNMREERFELTQKIFRLKKSVLDIYIEIKMKIDKIINENIELLESYPININATLSFKSEFQSKFLNFILLNRSGTFYGNDNAIKQFKKLTKEFNANSFKEIQSMLNGLKDALFYDLKEKEKEEAVFSNIEDQVKDVVGLYDYLFSLEFLEINYQLRQKEKDLFQLSPGEKGALLLIFYLLLDNNDIPLIIDQPEDNLDNHSVANILVPFIKKAKSKRQIIIVTHNPNLAVVADAEQIIYTELDKENNNEFKIKSGAIENPIINDCIVKVLEGAMPAFNKRKLKYYDKQN